MSHVDFKKCLCHMSLSLNISPCPLSNLRNANVPCMSPYLSFEPMSLCRLGSCRPVKFKEWPCRPVEFRGLGPNTWLHFSHFCIGPRGFLSILSIFIIDIGPLAMTIL